MNDRATFETASRLKAAGFPQPEPAPGQMWYNRFGIPYFVGTRYDGRLCFICSDGNSFEWPHDTNGFTYAPTATDILRELDEKTPGMALVYDSIASIFFCVYFMPTNLNTLKVQSEWKHDNPAEACASALLSQNEI